jgi:hypothetical protein
MKLSNVSLPAISLHQGVSDLQVLNITVDA